MNYIHKHKHRNKISIQEIISILKIIYTQQTSLKGFVYVFKDRYILFLESYVYVCIYAFTCLKYVFEIYVLMICSITCIYALYMYIKCECIGFTNYISFINVCNFFKKTVGSFTYLSGYRSGYRASIRLR